MDFSGSDEDLIAGEVGRLACFREGIAKCGETASSEEEEEAGGEDKSELDGEGSRSSARTGEVAIERDDGARVARAIAALNFETILVVVLVVGGMTSGGKMR